MCLSLFLPPNGHALYLQHNQPPNPQADCLTACRHKCSHIQRPVVSVLAHHSVHQRVHIHVAEDLYQVFREVVVLAFAIRAPDAQKAAPIDQVGQWKGF